MRIRQNFAIAGLLLLLLGGLAAWVVGDTYLRVVRMVDLQQIDSDVHNAGFRLALLTGDILLHDEIRSERQWRESNAGLRRILAEHRTTLAPYHRQTGNITRHADGLLRLIDQLQARKAAVIKAGRPLHDDEVYALLTSQTSIRITELQSAIEEFDAAVQESSHLLQGTSSEGITVQLLILLVLLVGLGAVAGLWLHGRIMRPLGNLEATIDRLAAGDSTVRAHKRADDEIGDVVDAFNTLLDKQQTAAHELATARDRAEMASQAKSAFVANMSHEIRTPMNAVLGLLQLLQHTALDARQLDYTKKAQGAAESLLAILNDILDFSKVEAGKMALDNAPFRLDELLRNLSVVLSSALDNKEVEVLFQLDPGVPRALRGDGLRLQQVLLNLAGNAIKFTERGEVIIALRLREAGPGAVRIEFSVRDTGIGIAADRLAAVFEGFMQAETSTARRYGGTGLGLAISQRLVRLMGGELAAESTPGQGSRFYFTLDFTCDEETRAHERAALSTRQPAPLPDTLRLLIVDDNAIARDVLASMATSFGWRAQTASSGAEAIEKLRAAGAAGTPFDILCVDWIMPGMDGWETVQHIRAMQDKAPTPAILMITAHGRELLAERLDGGANPLDGFLIKPVTPSMLFDAVAEITHGDSVSTDRRAVSRPTESRALAGLRLLVVEDNPLNQQVAQELLTHAGAFAQVANDGRQGIESVKTAQAAGAPYDAVLMDIQMPGMDGYAATRILREEMAATMPIIAMTANAMPSDRAACLAAGMNDHIAKPIDTAALIATLLRHCRGATSAPTAPAPATADAPLPALPAGFDLAAALARLDGNRRLFASLARRFDSDQAAIVTRAGHALMQGDHAGTARELHTLKGIAATLGATALARLAADAEARVNAGTTRGEDDALLADLREKLTRVTAILHTVADAFEPLLAAPAEALADPARVIEHLSALESLLAEHNMRALDVYATLKHEAGGMLGEHLGALDETIANLDFSAARKKAANLITMLKP